MSFRALHAILAALLAVLCVVAPARGDTLDFLNPPVDGGAIEASDVLGYLNSIKSIVNGNLTNGNVKAGAAIKFTKLDRTDELPVLRAANSRCLSAGTSGDANVRVTLNSNGEIQLGPGGSSALDLNLRRKDSSTFQFSNVLKTALKALEADSFNAATWGDAYPKASLTVDWLGFGDGANPLDTFIRREGAGQLSVTNAAGDTLLDLLLRQITVNNITVVENVTITQNLIVGGDLSVGGVVTGALGGSSGANDCRLSLSSLGPLTHPSGGSSNLYLWPYRGNKLALFNNSGSQVVYELNSGSLHKSITGTDNTNYDIFVYDTTGDSTGDPTHLDMEFVAWTNNTTRAVGITSVKGVLVKSGTSTHRYVGSFHCTGANTVFDENKERGLYNYYNRIALPLRAAFSDSWTSPGGGSSGTYEPLDANTTTGQGRVGIMNGVSEDVVYMQLCANCNSGGGTINIGVNSNSPKCYAGSMAGAAGRLKCEYVDLPTSGFNYYQALQAANLSAGYDTLGSANGPLLYGLTYQ